MPENEEEDPKTAICEYNGQILPRQHPVFNYQMEMRMAQAELGLAIAEGVRLQATRELLDMLDTLSQMLTDPDSKLPDQQRKMLNHADEVWLDMKEKMSQGDRRAAHLLNSSAHMNNALANLIRCTEDPDFSLEVPEYIIKYLGKLATFVYREAIGHLML